MRVKEIGEAKDAEQIQYNVVRVDGQNSYVPILKQGGDTNTIAVVDGTKEALTKLTGIPGRGSNKRRLRPVAIRQTSD